MSKKLMLIIAAAVLLLGGAGAGAYFYFYSSGGEQQPQEQPVGMMDMDPFLTNINDKAGRRHARLQIKLVIVPREKVAEIQADALLMARLRDRVLTLLTSKTYKELSGAEGKETFRESIRERLAPLLEDTEIKEVLFADFVVQ